MTPLLATKTHWTASGRWLVFLLAASSIACLLLDFYRFDRLPTG